MSVVSASAEQEERVHPINPWFGDNAGLEAWITSATAAIEQG